MIFHFKKLKPDSYRSHETGLYFIFKSPVFFVTHCNCDETSLYYHMISNQTLAFGLVSEIKKVKNIYYSFINYYYNIKYFINNSYIIIFYIG